jgi:hypothetical protein
VVSSVSLARPHRVGRAQPRSELSTNDRAVIGFATVQFFALIYAQKLSLFATSFALSVPMLIMFASVGYMIVSRNLSIVPFRIGVFLAFLGACLVSETFAQGSATSFMQVALLYVCMTVSAEVSGAAYRQILNRFTLFMIPPACMIFLQYGYQKLTGLGDPFNIELLIPKSLLTPGFFYNAHYPWYSTFSRPNGFFFLEPSFASAFTATATILEIAYFRRPWLIVMMGSATLLSMGATGALMLVLAAPFLLAREKPAIIVTVVAAVLAAGVAAYLLGYPLPLISRLNELDEVKSSAANRLELSQSVILNFLLNPSYLFLGDGAGSSPKVQLWPLVKILREYGAVAMTLFAILYVGGIAKRVNVALTFSLSIIYHFTGGYLLSPAMVELVILLCFVLSPKGGERAEQEKSAGLAIPAFAAPIRLRRGIGRL